MMRAIVGLKPERFTKSEYYHRLKPPLVIVAPLFYYISTEN